MEGETNRHRDPNTHLEQDICIHIFTVSSAMVGVCLTVIGLIRVVITLGRADTLADDLLAGDALLFLISCLLSYWALRSRSLRRMHRLEKIADGIFILAMIGMVIICALITYTISVPASTRRWLKQLFEDPQPIPAGLTLFRPSHPERRLGQLRINLSPALVVGHRYLHLLVRGVTAAVGAGDSNCIDASVAAALPLGSK